MRTRLTDIHLCGHGCVICRDGISNWLYEVHSHTLYTAPALEPAHAVHAHVAY